MNRFYKIVTTHNGSNGCEIRLDGRPVKTKAGHLLTTVHESLANEIMKEWAAQEDKIIPDSMPLTQFLTTKIDRVSHERSAMSETILKYLDTDLICYRAAQPPEMATAQQQTWKKPLEWFEAHYGAPLKTTTGLIALTHSAAAHDAASKDVAALDDDRFTILQLITALSGSLVLGLMATHQAISAEEIFRCMRVEADVHAKIYNEALHGPDPHQETKDRAAQKELTAAEVYLQLLR